MSRANKEVIICNTLTLDAFSGERCEDVMKCAQRITYFVDTQTLTCLLGRQAPSKEHDALVVFSVQDSLEDSVGERLPPLLSMRVGGVGADGKARIQP